MLAAELARERPGLRLVERHGLGRRMLGAGALGFSGVENLRRRGSLDVATIALRCRAGACRVASDRIHRHEACCGIRIGRRRHDVFHLTLLGLLGESTLADLLDDAGEGQSDDDEADDDDADHDDDDVAAAQGELVGVEDLLGDSPLGSHRHGEREQGEQRHEHEAEAHRDARGDPFAIEAHEEADAACEQEQRQQVGAQAEGEVQRLGDERCDDRVGGQDRRDHEDDGEDGEHDAGDVAPRALIEEMIGGIDGGRGLGAGLARALLSGRRGALARTGRVGFLLVG